MTVPRWRKKPQAEKPQDEKPQKKLKTEKKPQAETSGATALTFRISNIPSGVSREDLIKDLTKTLRRNSTLAAAAVSENTISIKSIAPSPCNLTEGQVAVVTFNPVPSCLEEAKHGNQQLQISMMEGTPSTFIANFDSHFIGLTPLNEISSGASYEYVIIISILLVLHPVSVYLY